MTTETQIQAVLTWTRRADRKGYEGQPGDYLVHAHRHDSGKVYDYTAFRCVTGRDWPIRIGTVRNAAEGKGDVRAPRRANAAPFF
jgi:hypothetical protein